MRKDYGWYFLAKEVADYANCTFFEIMERNVREVLFLVDVIQAKVELNKMNKPTEKIHG